jgi:hypothetical protein
VILWILAGETESFSTNALLQLYMRSHPTNTYTVAQNNNYPTGVPAVGIVSTLFWATLTDFMGGKRYLGKSSPVQSNPPLLSSNNNQKSRLLDSNNRHHNLVPHPRLPKQHDYPLRNVLLGRQRLRLPSDLLCMGQRRAAL